MQYSAVVAEDDPDIRSLLTSCLESWGYDVVATPDGRDALTAIAELRPDIALLDVSMPGLTGPEVIREMRNNAELSAIPAMLVTADTAGPSAQSGWPTVPTTTSASPSTSVSCASGSWDSPTVVATCAP